MPKKVLELMVSLDQLPESNFHRRLIFAINSVWGKFPKIQHLNPVSIEYGSYCMAYDSYDMRHKSHYPCWHSHFRAKYKIKYPSLLN